MNKKLPSVVLDFETRSEVDIRTCGAWKYAKHPSTEILMVGYNTSGVVGETDLWDITQSRRKLGLMLGLAASGREFIAHNAFFEYCIWNFVGVVKLGWKPMPLEQLLCSSAIAKYCSLPPNLEGGAMAMELVSQKDKEGKRLINKFSKPRRAKTGERFNSPQSQPDDWKKFCDYCVIDVDTTMELVNQLPELPKTERLISTMTDEINIKGIYIDKLAVEAALQLEQAIQEKYNVKASKIAKGYFEKVTQREKLMEWCAQENFPIPDVQALTIRRALAKPDIPKKVKKVLRIRQICGSTAAAKYRTIVARLADDGRIHELLSYHRARTGRFGGMGFQIQNLIRPTLPYGTDYDEIVELIKKNSLKAIEKKYDNPMEVIASAIRSMITAPKGKILVSSDYSAIEARVLLWLAKDYEGLDIFRRGDDIYLYMAADIYKVPLSSLNKKSSERPLGKETVLGCGFGMGSDKFKTNCKDKAGITLTVEEAENAVNSYRSKFDKVPKLWKGLEKAAMAAVKQKGVVFSYLDTQYKCIGKFLVCRLPSGKKLFYLNPEIRVEKTSWGTEKDTITYMGQDSYTRKWCRLKTYGGKLCENAVQAEARNLMVYGMLKLREAGYEMTMSVHDEIVTEVDFDKADLVDFEQLMTSLPVWAVDCPVEAEGWVGMRYRK